MGLGTYSEKKKEPEWLRLLLGYSVKTTKRRLRRLHYLSRLAHVVLFSAGAFMGFMAFAETPLVAHAEVLS